MWLICIGLMAGIAITISFSSWTAVSNGNYRVQYKSSLTATNWTDLVGDVTAFGTTASKSDISTTANRFYRVQVLP